MREWWSAGTDQLLYHLYPYTLTGRWATTVKCWNRPVTISPAHDYTNKHDRNGVKCWNRPVTISPPTVKNLLIRWSQGEVLEQTSYYITFHRKEEKIKAAQSGEVLEQTSYYITTLYFDGESRRYMVVKCWNRPVTISPGNSNMTWNRLLLRWSAGTDQLLYHL